jgi:hypothetical protein
MARSTRTPTRTRQVERRLTRVGLLSVTVVSAIVSVLLCAMVFLAGVLLWRYGVGTGLVERAEELAADITGDGTFELDGPTLFVGWAAVCGGWALVLTVIGALLGVIVNVACVLTGGIRMRFRWNVAARLAPAPAESREHPADGAGEPSSGEDRSAEIDPPAEPRAA